MNNFPSKKIGILLCAAGFILTGMVTTLYTLLGLISFEKANELLQILPSINELIYYNRIPESWRNGLLGARLILAVLQIIIGVCLVTLKPWALKTSRIFLTVFMIVTFFNPYYPNSIIVLITTIYMAMLFYLNHHSAKEIFLKEEKVYPHSSSILILGALESLIGLGLTQWMIWMPDTGSQWNIIMQSGTTLIINIPKASTIFLCLLLVFTGLTTLAYKPAGRICNNILCVFLFFATCAAAIFVKPPTDLIYRIIFLAGIIVTLITASSFYLLFTNPHIKLYFHSDNNLPWRRRYFYLIVWGAICGLMLGIIHNVLRQFPHLFELNPTNPFYKAKMDSQKRQQDFFKKLFP